METFGYPEKAWSAAKDQARAVLTGCARGQQTISYSELVRKISAIDLLAHDPRLDELLNQLSVEEAAAGRGMLSVVVVHKSGDMRPGRGFVSCAEELGFDTSDAERLWVEQLTKVFATWGGSRA